MKVEEIDGGLGDIGVGLTLHRRLRISRREGERGMGRIGEGNELKGKRRAARVKMWARRRLTAYGLSRTCMTTRRRMCMGDMQGSK
jgi:hypothetical protein